MEGIHTLCFVGAWAALFCQCLTGQAVELAGVAVVPHADGVAEGLRYSQTRGPADGALVQLFLRNAAAEPFPLPAEVTFGDLAPAELVARGDWSWHDLPGAADDDEPHELPPGGLTVWSFNAAGGGHGNGVGTRGGLRIAPPSGPPHLLPIAIEPPEAWLSAVTFLHRASAWRPIPEAEPPVEPDTLVLHVENRTKGPLQIERCRLWAPRPDGSFRALFPGEWLELDRFPADGSVPPGDHGGAIAAVARPPLSSAAVEVQVRDAEGATTSLWAGLRVKCEHFAIGGGWIDGSFHGRRTLHCEEMLRTLRRMHVDAGMHGMVPGYTDDPVRWALCPARMMNRCWPLAEYDTPSMLPRVHAVEFLGEPQYGGGRAVPPDEVWRALAPYRRSRLPTSLTHSEERVWRHYAGLSDHPHYDAYRVCAPAADAWGRYDRWGDAGRIHWAAPLETIGELTRSLRELNRPRPIAAWAQGPHEGWKRRGGRSRTSPTPDELRVQAWHALAARITSLYWFNLNLPALVEYRDLIDPVTRLGREMRVLAPLLLEGTGGPHARIRKIDGRPDWDLAAVHGPQAAVLVALDLDYHPDPEAKVFRFGPPRPATWRFPLPSHLHGAIDVFRFDADGVTDAAWRIEDGTVVLEDTADRVVVHVATADPALRARLEEARRALVAHEQALEFDPAARDQDFARLAALLNPPPEDAAASGGPADAVAVSPTGAAPATVAVTLSTADGSRRLTEEPPRPLVSTVDLGLPTVQIDRHDAAQSLLGLGASFDHASCENLARLDPAARAEVIERLFHPQRGIGMSLMRVCIGSSDFTGEPYATYCDLPAGETDPDLARFSIDMDRPHVLPVIRAALACNPRLLLFGSPWSPPAWMKSSGRLGGGRLERRWYRAYARYLLEFVRAYEAEGLPIHALTVQNEPQMAHPGYPTTLWTAAEQRDFIRDHLGPLFEREGCHTLIWCWDHNWNDLEFPRTVLADPEAARFLDGIAFHLYEGHVEAQSRLHREFPGKHVYFTEGSVFGIEGAATLVDILRNWSRSYNAWVFMLDQHRRPNSGPHHASATCLELLDDGTVRSNLDYFLYGQFMRYLRPGAVRIRSIGPPIDGLRHVAFRSEDGELVLVAVNARAAPLALAVDCGGRGFTATLPAQAVATYRWRADD
jgi:glucosylceramidase